jgi:hypothetical protein
MKLMVKRLLITMAAAAALLSAADAPKTLSPEFMKAGLKALITVKNSSRRFLTPLEKATLTDAEVAVSNENDKQVLMRIWLFSVRVGTRNIGGEHDYNEATAACGDSLEKMLRGGKFIDAPVCEADKISATK